MNFHSMKRKQLQALCKKHKIPANLSNLELANKLTEFLKEKEDPLIQRPIQGQDENVSETESADVVVNRKVKKVRFSPEHELIEFTRSPEIKRRSRRNTVLSKYSSLSVVNVDSGEMNKENLGEQGSTTRSRGLKSMEAKVNGKKRGINAVNCNGKVTNAPAIEVFDNGKLKEGDVQSSGRVMLLRGKKIVEGKKIASKRENKRAKDDDKRDEKALDNVDDEKLIQEIVDNPCRVTRSRVQKLTEVSAREEKRGRKVAKRNCKVALVRAETEENSVSGTSSFINRGDVGEGKLARDSDEKVKSKGKEREEVLKNKKVVEEHDVTEPQILLRRSIRNTNRVADSEILNVDTRKHENGESKGLRKTSKLLASDGETGNEVNLGRRAVLEEPIKVEPRRSNRRKNVIESDELKAESENRPTLRSSVPQLGIAGEVSKDEKKVTQATGDTRRSRHKSSSLKLVSTDEEFDTDLVVENLEAETESKRPLRSSVPQSGTAGEVSKDEKNVLQPTGVRRRSRRKTCLKLVSADEETDTELAVENLEAEKHKSEPCLVEKECSAAQKNTRRSRRNTYKCKSPGLVGEIGGDSFIPQKNKVMKRKRGPISGGDVIMTNNDPSSVAETMKESNSKKAVPAAATAKVSNTRKRTCRLNDLKVLDASSHNGLEIREPLLMNAKLSESECLGSTSNLGFSTETSAKNIISDVGLTSGRKTHRKKSDISIADSAEISDMKLINGKELANSDTNAASGNKELKTDFTDFEDQVSVSNIRGVEKDQSPLEIDVHELLIEQYITDMNKNDPEAQVLSQTEDSGFHNKIDNQVLQEGSNVSGEEGFAETSSSADSLLLGELRDIKTDLEVAEVEAGKCLQPNPSVVDHVGEVKGISVHENLDSEERRQENQVLPEGSNVSAKEGFAETSSSADSLLLGDQTDIKTDLEVAEAEADKCLQPSPDVVDHVGEVKGISVQENLDFDEVRQDDQVLPEGSNVSGKEGFMETGSFANNLLLGDQTYTKTDLEVVEAEADICLQPSPGGDDYVGEVQGNSVQENLDSDETRQDNQVLPVGPNVSGNEGFAETDSSVDRLLLGDLPDVRTHLEVAEAEGDEGIFVQENLDFDETRQANDISSPVSCHHIDMDHLEASSNIEDKNNEDTSPQAGEVRGFESCERPIDYTHSSELKAPSSCMLRRLEGANMAEGNEAFFHKGIALELAETNEDGCLNIHKSASSQYSEFSVPYLSDGERSASIVPQDICSSEYSAMSSDKQGKYKDSLAVAPITIRTNSAEINLMRGHEADHIPKSEETYIDKSTKVEDGETIEGGSSKSHKSECDEDGEFSVCNLFDAEGRSGIMPQDKEVISGDYSIEDFNEQGMCHGSPSVAPTDLIAEGNEAFIYKDKQSESVEADESGCLKSHKSSKDDWGFSVSKLFDSEKTDADESGCLKSHKSSKVEDWEVSVSNLFDSEKSGRITPQDRGIVSAEYSIKDFNEHVMFPDFPAVSTTSANYKEVKFSEDTSNLQEISPSKPNSVSDSQAEQPESPLAKLTAFANTIQRPETWSNASETTRHAMFSLKTNAEGNISQVVEGSSTYEDANDAKCGKDKEGSSGACITDVKISTDCTQRKIEVEGLSDMKFQDAEETEQQIENLLAMQIEPAVGEEPTDVESSPSWTEIGLHNLFGATLDDDTPSGLNDSFSQGTELANLTMSTDQSISKNRGSFTKEKEVEGERSECVKITNENVVSPATFSEVSHTGFNVDMEEKQLATPIKIVAPCKIDETCSHDRKLDRTVMSVMECYDTTKENAVTQNMSSEKVEDAGYELENSFCLGDPLPDNSEDVTCEELNKVESVELVNTTTTVLSEAEHDGCEASEELTENTGECLKETNLMTEEDTEEKVSPLGESCLYDEAQDNDSESTEKNIISSSHSPRILDKLEGCQDMLTDVVLSESLSCKRRVCHKSEGEMTQSSEGAFKLSDSDLQKSNVPEKKSHHINACSEDGNILGEASVETFRGPLGAEVPDGQKDVTDKGTSSCHFSKASPDCDEVTERGDSMREEEDDPYGSKIWDETDGNSRSSQDISDEPHTNDEVAILELQSTCKKAKETVIITQNPDNIVAAAEHGSSVCCVVSGMLSNSPAHLHLGDNENGDIEKSEAGTPIFNFDVDHEKNGKEVEESSMATKVQFPIPQFLFEEKVEERNNHIHAISDVPSSGCNEILNESDVADTIKEYIDSESSLSMIFENSGVSLPINVLAHTDERTACENEEDVAERLANSEGEDDKPSIDCLDTGSKELEEETLFVEPAPGSGEAVKSPCVDFLSEGSTATKPVVETKGTDVKLDSQKQNEAEDGNRSSSKQLCSIAKKNARTILIHGTPGKLLTMADMKENAPTRKGSNVGDLTTVRPAKRRALQNVQWK